MSVLSFTLTPNARFLPSNPNVQIQVTAYQWGFKYEYPNGLTSQTLNVPSNSTILFNVTSPDVMHNFYLPDFRVSIDAIPGLYNSIWVQTPEVSGNSTLTYRVLCKELCGSGHTFMFSSLRVMSQDAYNAFLANQTSTSSGG
jgi:cytochrome c oxidase subunit 2